MARTCLLALALGLAAARAGAEALPNALVPGAEEELKLRVRVLRHGPAYFDAEGGKPLRMNDGREAIDDDTEVAIPALGVGGRRVPVLLGSGTALRLIVHLPVDLLGLVALEDARVFADAASAAKPDSGFITLHPGFLLKDGKAKGEWLRVRYRDDIVDLSGVVRRGRVGYAYPETQVFSESPNAEVRGDAQLLSRPGGPVLARLISVRSSWIPARLVGPVERGHRRIRVTFPEVRIDAWTRANLVREAPESGTGVSWGHSRASGLSGGVGRQRLKLAAGTRLRRTAGGPIVGLVVKESEHSVVRQEPGKPPVIRVRTEFGDAELVAEPPERK